jgi:mono/diheme cytochrome c family protein
METAKIEPRLRSRYDHIFFPTPATPIAVWVFVGFATFLFMSTCSAQEFHADIPRAWDDDAVAGLELPLAQRDRSPRYMSAEEYYKLKVRPIYRAYPVYLKGREPAGYLEALKQKDPEIIFDPSKLHTKEDWIQAGKLVFESDTRFSPARSMTVDDISLPPSTVAKISKDGVLPSFTARYYIREKGVLELGGNSCAGCHTRDMPDGSFLEGGQGIPFPPRAVVLRAKQETADQTRRRLDNSWIWFGAPWVMSREEFEAEYTPEAFALLLAAERPGVFARQGTSWSHPVHIPSLIGVQGRKYIDATGLVRNRSIGDLMRYAILNEGLDTLAYFGDFQPSPHATVFSAEEGTRYSDEQLYALALYISSLKPPSNPNKFDDHARRGQVIFQRQACVKCHTPPLYTNNKLTPATGFRVPDDLRKTDDILNVSVGTDPYLTLKTRRGTGFYKVPSLQGVWFRSAFGHFGQAETLEEWFDPARLQPDYVPRGFHLAPGPIQGHPFGLNLSAADKLDLIAFLRTL